MNTSALVDLGRENKADMDRMVRILVSGDRDPAFEREIATRAALLREETFRSHGLLDIGVELIHEVRDRG